jgi:methyl-galactoside transport system substrate-binding protein
MKKKLVSTILAAAMVGTMTLSVPVMAAATDDAATEAVNADLADKKVGVCIYQFSDNFMTLFRTELESYLVAQGFSEDNITIQDGQNDQATQSNQIDAFIADGVDVLIVNLVNSSSAATVTDKVVEAGIPLVYINREPDEAEEARWEENGWDVTYVGCDARQSGTMQGELIVDLGLDTVDKNGNGQIDYVMIEGDPENVDAQYRTEYSIQALEDAGLEVNCLDDQVGNWDQATAQQLVANSLSQYGDDVEVVFCNNDAMALGALQSIQAAGRTVGEDIFLVGVDALSEALEDVVAGTMTGTVFNDHISQSHASADAAINYLTGAGNDHYIGCDYVKVTSDNVEEIQEMLK